MGTESRVTSMSNLFVFPTLAVSNQYKTIEDETKYLCLCIHLCFYHCSKNFSRNSGVFFFFFFLSQIWFMTREIKEKLTFSFIALHKIIKFYLFCMCEYTSISVFLWQTVICSKHKHKLFCNKTGEKNKYKS